MRKFIPVALLLLCQLPLHASDWPCYRGAAQDGVIREQGLLLSWPAEGLSKLWSVPVDGKGTHAGPAIANGKVFISGRAGTKDVIRCLDALSGASLWKYEYEAPGNVSYGPGPRATPVISGDLVFTLGAFGHLLCLKADNGEKVWERNFVTDFKGVVPNFGIAAAPLVDGERLFCETGGPDAGIVALEKATGKELWRSGKDAASYAAPQIVTLAGVRQVLCFPATGLVSLAPEDGTELWRFRYNDGKNIAAPVIKDDCIYLSDNNNGFSALKIISESGKWRVEKLWSNTNDKAHTSSPVIVGDSICFYQWLEHEGQIKSLSIKDGHRQWSLSYKGDDMNGNLLAADDRHLIAGLSSGEVLLLEVSAEAGKESARFKATDPGSFAPLAVAGGRLYVRDLKALHCFNLKAK